MEMSPVGDVPNRRRANALPLFKSPTRFGAQGIETSIPDTLVGKQKSPADGEGFFTLEGMTGIEPA